MFMRLVRFMGAVVCMAVFLVAGSMTSRAQPSTFPHPYYNTESDLGKEWIDADGRQFEDRGIFSVEQYRQITNADRSIFRSGTIASDDGVEFPMFFAWFMKFFNAKTFVSSTGETVTISTVQVPDEDHEIYGTTVSNLDLRNEELFNLLSYCTDSSGYVRYYIRVICKPYLSTSETTRNKLNALNVMSFTQRDTPAVRALITPLLTDPNEKVKEEAEFTLQALLPSHTPADPWDSKQ